MATALDSCAGGVGGEGRSLSDHNGKAIAAVKRAEPCDIKFHGGVRHNPEHGDCGCEPARLRCSNRYRCADRLTQKNTTKEFGLVA